jgi:nitroreductase
MRLDLTPDELLTTTRSVRKRLDLERPVEREVIEECIEIALQAPTGSNMQHWHWVVVDEQDKKDALAALYRRYWAVYSSQPAPEPRPGDTRVERLGAVKASAQYLADHLHEVPYLVVPCAFGRLPAGADVGIQAGYWGSVFPAIWSFMLAARARGLGTSLTTLHLQYEREAADVLDIPYSRVTQCGLIPVAYTKGTDFKPAPRQPLASVLHWNSW